MGTIVPGPGVAVTAVAAAVILFWSGTPIANKVAVASMDPMTAGVTRSMLAGLVGAGIGLAARLPLPDSPRRWGLLALSGICSFAVWPMLLSVGLGRTTANHAALVMALLPVLTGLIALGVDRRLPRPGWWVGTAVALAGTFLLVLQRSGGALLTEAGDPVGDAIILGGTLVCAAGYVAGGRLSRAIGTWSTTFWGLAMALTVLVPSFLLRADRTDWSSVGASGWGAIAYMTLISSLLGYAAWFWALGRGGIARVGSWQLAQPVLTVALAALLLGEPVTPPLALCAVAIVTGTAIVQRQAGSRRPPGRER